MASDLNSVNLVGRLTRDPELRQTAGGMQVCDVGLAINSTQKNKATDEWEDVPNFFNVVIFGAKAEATAKYCKRGDRFATHGRLQQQKWETDEGGKKEKVQVVADTVHFLTTKAESAERSSSTPDEAPKSEVEF
jgi:single-strand DNA-binding protein